MMSYTCMCKNCVTPRKCNGPNMPARVLPSADHPDKQIDDAIAAHERNMTDMVTLLRGVVEQCLDYWAHATLEPPQCIVDLSAALAQAAPPPAPAAPGNIANAAHIYAGACPCDEFPTWRDYDCPACLAMIAAATPNMVTAVQMALKKLDTAITTADDFCMDIDQSVRAAADVLRVAIATLREEDLARAISDIKLSVSPS